MNCLLLSIRNDLLKLCNDVNLINKNEDLSNIISEEQSNYNFEKKRDLLENQEDKNNKQEIDISVSNLEKDKQQTNDEVIISNIKKKKSKKEIPLEDRCNKIIKKNNKEVRCSFRKIEEKDFCKKHLKN